jgi:hypothetical protein
MEFHPNFHTVFFWLNLNLHSPKERLFLSLCTEDPSSNPIRDFLTILFILSLNKHASEVAASLAPEFYQTNWNDTDDSVFFVASGTYIYRLQTGGSNLTHKRFGCKKITTKELCRHDLPVGKVSS